jgi:hypothetical protein
MLPYQVGRIVDGTILKCCEMLWLEYLLVCCVENICLFSVAFVNIIIHVSTRLLRNDASCLHLLILSLLSPLISNYPPLPFELRQHLFHILLSKINQYTSNGILPRLRFANTHVRVQCDLWCISRIVSIREADFKGRWRVTHEE